MCSAPRKLPKPTVFMLSLFASLGSVSQQSQEEEEEDAERWSHVSWLPHFSLSSALGSNDQIYLVGSLGR